MVSFGPVDTEARRCEAALPKHTFLSITQAICDYRRSYGTDGPLYMARTARSIRTGQRSALEFFGQQRDTIIQSKQRRSRQPGYLRAILVYNRGRSSTSGRHR